MRTDWSGECEEGSLLHKHANSSQSARAKSERKQVQFNAHVVATEQNPPKAAAAYVTRSQRAKLYTTAIKRKTSCKFAYLLNIGNNRPKTGFLAHRTKNFQQLFLTGSDKKLLNYRQPTAEAPIRLRFF